MGRSGFRNVALTPGDPPGAPCWRQDVSYTSLLRSRLRDVHSLPEVGTTAPVLPIQLLPGAGTLSSSYDMSGVRLAEATLRRLRDVASDYPDLTLPRLSETPVVRPVFDIRRNSKRTRRREK